MHQQVRDFLLKAKVVYPGNFNDCSVLELGSLDINGSPRGFFDGCEYVGIDRIAGPGVDIVCNAHEYKSRKKFDTIVTTEMLEHDKYADLSVKNALKLLKKGGLLIGTAANVNRPAHYEDVGEQGHYRNISADMVKGWGKCLLLEEDEDKQDIRFIIAVL